MSSFYTRKGVVSLQIRLYFVWPFFVSYLLIRNFMEVNEPVLLSLSAFSFFSFLFLCCLILYSGLQMYLSREKTQNCHCLKLHFLPSGELKRSCLMSDLQDC